MKYQEITNLYRQIGREFRASGAEKVILVSSRVPEDNGVELSLEIAVDGICDVASLEEKSKALWPDITMQIIQIGKEQNRLQEFVEDGVII